MVLFWWSCTYLVLLTPDRTCLCVCSFVKTFRETRRVEYTRAMVMSLAVISVFMLLPGPAQDYLVDYTVQVSKARYTVMYSLDPGYTVVQHYGRT